MSNIYKASSQVNAFNISRDIWFKYAKERIRLVLSIHIFVSSYFDASPFHIKHLQMLSTTYKNFKHFISTYTAKMWYSWINLLCKVIDIWNFNQRFSISIKWINGLYVSTFRHKSFIHSLVTIAFHDLR